jgi:hypothetical protein
MTQLNVNIDALNYTDDEYSNWDSYTSGIACYSPYPNANNSQQAWYMTEFKKVLVKYFNLGYQAYRGIIIGKYDIKKLFLTTANFDDGNALTYTSFSLNEAYNIARSRGDVTDFNWLADSQVQSAMAWLEDFLTQLFNIQNMSHTDINGNVLDMTVASNTTIDTYGSFKMDGGYNVGYNLGGHIWFCTRYLGILCHYTHLFTTPFIIKARKCIYASMTAQYNTMKRSNSFAITLSNAQWAQSIAGVCLHTTFILQSEKILRQRGYWHASDVVYVSNNPMGIWTNADLINISNSVTDLCYNYVTKYGFREFITSYYGYSLNMLIKILLHAPTVDIFNKINTIFKMFWWDFCANYLTKSNCLSGPMNRAYRPFSGVTETFDHLYIDPFITPYLNANKRIVPPISSELEYEFNVFSYCMRVAGGSFYMPTDNFNLLTNKPYRVIEQRFSDLVGQERYNYVTPNFTIGHCGEDYYENVNNSLVAIRLAGQRNTSTPAPDNTNCVDIIRFMMESIDTPFLNTGQNNQLSARLMCAQYQNFLLTTSLACPSNNMTEAYPLSFPYCLNTNIMLPLCVDGLWVSNGSGPDVALPKTVGTLMAIPPNAVFTIRHLGATAVVRIILATRSSASNILDATSVISVPSYVAGNQPYSLMWQVETDGYNLGTGRVVIHHKHPTDPSMEPYFVSTLMGAMDTPTLDDQQKFTNYMKSVPIVQSVTSNHDGVSENKVSDFSVSATIGTNVLNVTRQETFLLNNGWTPYNERPYKLTKNSRTVNNVPMLQFSETENPFRYSQITSLYKPY